ncbi:methylisocitrate lyase [Marinibaculum pumilum]|uniref:Methylisocitrate lyase n=1 Tax=Marinibaculum pumilum TaxID=1766165 RepID=A0ABV7KZW6_9PROT
MTDPLWLERDDQARPPAGDRLAALIGRDRILGVPGAHSGMAALLAKRTGFEALYLSGAALTASMGLPDLGIITPDELARATREIVRASDLPLIVDGDTGYGEALNVMRLVRDLEDAGAAAVQIEDQQLPKKCGHLNDKKLVPAEEMAAKVAAARKARRHLRIIARTDAAAESLDEAIRRMRLYVEAGADIIFPEALTGLDAIARVREAVDVPLLGNMTEFGRTPYMTDTEWQQLGFDIVIWPVSSLRVAAKAMTGLYAHIREEGGTVGLLEQMQTRAELYDTISYFDYEELDGSVARSVLPTIGENKG